MARRYIIATKIEKRDPQQLESVEKVYYKYYGQDSYCFNRSVILDSTQTKIIKGFQEIFQHGFKSIKDAQEYLVGAMDSDNTFTDNGQYKKTSSIISFYFVPRY